MVWNGAGKRRFALGRNLWKLGIANTAWRGGWGGAVPIFIWTKDEDGDSVVGYGGWGFGQANQYRSRQEYTWAGRRTGNTVFEISVKGGSLTPKDRARLLVTKSGRPRDPLPP